MFNDSSKFAGQIKIRIIDESGKARHIWQEYKTFHFLRKHFGIKFPKISFITGFFDLEAVYDNLVTTSGKGLISGRINGVGSPAAPTYMAVGTGTTAAAAGNTTLEIELSGDGFSRTSGTPTIETTTVTDDTCQLVASWTSTSVPDVAVTEMGILNVASSGDLLVRNVFSAYTLRTNDTFEITHQLKNA